MNDNEILKSVQDIDLTFLKGVIKLRKEYRGEVSRLQKAFLDFAKEEELPGVTRVELQFSEDWKIWVEVETVKEVIQLILDSENRKLDLFQTLLSTANKQKTLQEEGKNQKTIKEILLGGKNPDINVENPDPLLGELP